MDILELPGVVTTGDIPNRDERKRTFDADIAGEQLPICPRCLEEGCIHRHGFLRLSIRDTPLYGDRIVIHFILHRYRCNRCGKVFHQQVAGLAPNKYMTQRCADWIAKQGLSTPFDTVAEQVGCDAKTVRNITLDYVKALEKAHSASLPRWLAIDEAHPVDRLIRPKCHWSW